MIRYVLAGVFCIAAVAAMAAARQIPEGFAQCAVLDDCLSALDTVAKHSADGSSSNMDAGFAARLAQFGQPAKRELLKRAAGEDRGWRNLAGAILMNWPSFEPADVPALIAVLRKEPGGWIARPLGRLGTPEAVAALADDVRQNGASNQSGWALSQIGDQVFPYLLPLLSDDKRWHDAAEIMGDMKLRARDGLDGWLAIALDPKQPERDRIGALRGIGILGTSAKDVAPKLRPLLTADNGYGAIDETVRKVLAAMGDRTVAAETVLACAPSTDPSEGSFESRICLEQAAYHGEAILPYANLILSAFLNSRTGMDRANGASVLGFIGYAPAKQRLIELLEDPDWRVVYAAARSLGWLKAREAVPALRKIASGHWLAEVRDEAARAIAVLQSQTGDLPRPDVVGGSLDYPPRVPLELDATFAPDVAPCRSGQWTWRAQVFREPSEVAMTAHLPGGDLAGRDSGEWGGEVMWKPASQVPSYVAQGNVEGIERVGDGAIAVIGGGGIWTSYDAARGPRSANASTEITISNGPGGSGYALRLRRDASGAWRVAEIARFPRAAFGLIRIDRDLFAVWSGNRAIVFRPSGIAGVAACVAAP